MLGFCFLFFWCLSGFGASSFFLVPANVWWLWSLKTLAGTKKNQAQSHKTLAGTKKNKKTQSQRLLRTLDPHRLEICVFFVFFGACQCFVRLCLVFFCVCAGLMSLLGVEKERQYLHCLLCSFSFKNHVPMVPKTVGKSCFAKWPFRSSLAVLGWFQIYTPYWPLYQKILIVHA